MDNVINFNFQDRSVRIVKKDGEPWFVAKDIAEVLGYQWAGIRNVQHIPEEWRTEVFARYEEETEIGYSRNMLVRKIKAAFPGLTYKQKKIDGYPVLIFSGCQLKHKQAITAGKEAV